MTVNGDCYFTRECEALGVPLLCTPVPSFKEQGLVEGQNCYYIPFEVDNIDINKIVNNIPEYEGYIKKDGWKEILVKSKSKYNQEQKDIKSKVLEDFTLQDFDELENIERASRFKNTEGHLYKDDTFYCDQTMFEYLTIIPNRKPLIERIENV